ncbi:MULTISPECIES: hypothetical protein [unclassified Colwellia]|uniref:hypothetical protein n=1 Tax=unclassified Colwellia TaxID=196834 RepID=UPI0015F40F04|nr:MULTISPECIES: hypothetical protein [unclassified Colwellia]MBA6378972.1 hypothetical protein [Colwellia sp. BRX10-7]MBA6386613.1 hypothetical protein [Colwellia sp. BRX10-2]MBA6401080.1 hypothetical protein [Colwellia sp. BRX10-5]MBA6405695.1 hypothetical protein [Colwellia sp. BRX10-1]
MKFLPLILLTLISLNSYAKKSFEGVITYSISAISLNKSVSDSEVQNIYGYEMKTYYKEGFTKIEKSNDNVWEVYISKENKQYVRFRNSNKVETFDGSDETRTLASIKIKSSDLTILGYKTQLLTIQYQDGSISKYWYSSDIYVEPEQFKKLKFAFLNKYWEKAQSPYLKHERISDVSKVVYLATNVKEQAISNEKFRVF